MASVPRDLFYAIRSFVRDHWFLKYFVLPIWCIATLLALVLAPIIRGGVAATVELVVAYMVVSLVAVAGGLLIERLVRMVVNGISFPGSDRGRE
jgi:hypothetical protein